MPIKFRCPHCRQFLGISRSKAGALTDCPTCGRTIRIPDLDGTVKPVPGPALNLGDSELAGALDALARLDAPAEGKAPPRGETGPPPISVKAIDIQELEPVPVAEPVEVEPALPAEPAASSRSHAGPHAAGTVKPSADALDELIRLDPAAAVGESASRRTVSKMSALLVIVVGIFVFGIGVITGRLTAPSAGPDKPTSLAGGPSPEEQASSTPADEIPPEPDGERIPALSGRLTYASQSGVEPDRGARVIVFPKERQGTARLPVVGFRAGADPADQALARTSIRALGGDYATADEEGRYTVRLGAAGEYRVLFLSRFQPRDESGFLEPALQETLASYFDRPAALIGPVAYEFTEFTFRGDAAVPQDHVFPED